MSEDTLHGDTSLPPGCCAIVHADLVLHLSGALGIQDWPGETNGDIGGDFASCLEEAGRHLLQILLC